MEQNFYEQAEQVSHQAANYIEVNLGKDPVIFFDTTNEDEDDENDISDYPEFVHWSSQGINLGTCNITKVFRDEKTNEVMVEGREIEFWTIQKTKLQNLDIPAMCSLADLLSTKLKDVKF